MIHDKRILFVAPSAYPLGGVATWLDYVTRGLRDLGWDVCLGLTSGHHHDVDTYLDVHVRVVDPIVIKGGSGSVAGRVLALARLMESINPDLVVGVNVVDAYSAVRRLRVDGTRSPRIAMSIHGLEPDLFEDVASNRDVLDGVICSNRLACSLVASDAGYDSMRVHYAPYGVMTPTFEGASSECTTSDSRDTHVLRLCYVGRLEQGQKRVLDIPPILDELDALGVRFELLIAGAGPAESLLRERLSERVRIGQVRFCGVLNATRLDSDVYGCCDVLLVTSSWETGPIVLWEAMAAGVAVVSSRYVGAGLEAGLVDGENCRCFDIGDTPGAAVAIAGLSAGRTRARLVRGGRRLVEDRYSRARSIEAWSRSLEAVLDAPSLGMPELRSVGRSGRIDRILGPIVGERIRRLLGIHHRQRSAGAEWPHSAGRRRSDDPGFAALARALDSSAVLESQ